MAFITHWFLLHWSEYLLHALLAKKEWELVHNTNVIVGLGRGTSVEEMLDNVCFQIKASVKPKVTTASTFLLKEDIGCLQTLQQVGAPFFTS